MDKCRSAISVKLLPFRNIKHDAPRKVFTLPANENFFSSVSVHIRTNKNIKHHITSMSLRECRQCIVNTCIPNRTECHL